MEKFKQKHPGKKNICTTSIGVQQTGQGDYSGRRFVQPSQKGWPQLRTRFMGLNQQTLHKSATAFASGSPPSRGGGTAFAAGSHRFLRGGRPTGRRGASASGSPRFLRGGRPTGRRGASTSGSPPSLRSSPALVRTCCLPLPCKRANLRCRRGAGASGTFSGKPYV
jgi:hypothetical protein